jgi:hypothetical protein
MEIHTYAAPASCCPIDPHQDFTVDAGALQRLHDQLVVNDFLASTRASKTRLEDARIQRRLRQLKAPAVQSRGWYVTEDDWLRFSGAADIACCSAAEAESDVELGDDPASWDCYVVEREPEANEVCAVSGEPFRVDYNADLDKWIIRDAVVVAGMDAGRLRVPSGSLIKVQCLGRLAVPLLKNKRIKYGKSMGSQ